MAGSLADPVPADGTVVGQGAEAEENNNDNHNSSNSNNGGWTKTGGRFQFLNPAKRKYGKKMTASSPAGDNGRFSSARGSGGGEEIVNHMRALQPQQLLMQPPKRRFRSSRVPAVATIADGEPSDQQKAGPGGDRRSPSRKQSKRNEADHFPNAVEPFLSTDSSDDSPSGSLFSNASSMRRLGPRRKIKNKKGGSQLGLDASGGVNTSAVLESYMPAALPSRRRSIHLRNGIPHQDSFGSSTSMVAGGTRDVPYLARAMSVRSHSSFRLHTVGSAAGMAQLGEGGENADRSDDDYVDITDVADDRPQAHSGAAGEDATEDGFGDGGVGCNGRRRECVRARSTEAMIISSISRSKAKAAAAGGDAVPTRTTAKTTLTTTTAAASSSKLASEERRGAGEEGIGRGRKRRDGLSSTLPATARLIAAAAAIQSPSATATAKTETTALPTSTIAASTDIDSTVAVGEISDDKRDAPTPTVHYYTPQARSAGGEEEGGHASENFIASGASTSKDFHSQSFPASPSDAGGGGADVGGGVSGGGVLEAYRSAISCRGGGFGRSEKGQNQDVMQASVVTGGTELELKANKTEIRPVSTTRNATEQAPVESRRSPVKRSDSNQQQAGLGGLGGGGSGLSSRHSSKSKLYRMDSLLQMADVVREGSHSEAGSNRGSSRRGCALEHSLGGGRGGEGGQPDQLDGAFDYDQQGLGSDGEEVDEAFNIVFSQMMRADAGGSEEMAFENAMGIMAARQMDEGAVDEEQFEELRARQDGHHDADDDYDDDDNDDRHGNGTEDDEVFFVSDRLADGYGARDDDLIASDQVADDDRVNDKQKLLRQRSDGQLMTGGHLRGDSWWRVGADKALAEKRWSKTSNATIAATPPIKRKVRCGYGKESGSGRWTSGAGSSPGSTISAQEQAKRDWERKNGIRGGGALRYAFRPGSTTSGRTSSWGLSDAHSGTDGTATENTGEHRSGRRTRRANSSKALTTDGERKGNGDELPSGTSDWSGKEESESSPLSTESSDFLTSNSSQQSSWARGEDEGGDGGDDMAGDEDDFTPIGLPPPSPSGSEEDQEKKQDIVAGASKTTATSSSTTTPPGRKSSTGRRHSILWGDFTAPVKQKAQNKEKTYDTEGLAQKYGERAEPKQPAEVADPIQPEAHADLKGREESQGPQERGEAERRSAEAGKVSDDRDDPVQRAIQGAPAPPAEMAPAAPGPDGTSDVAQEQRRQQRTQQKKQQRPENKEAGQPGPILSGAAQPRTERSKAGEFSASALQKQKLDAGKLSKTVKRSEPQEQPKALRQQTDTGTSDEGPINFEKRGVWKEAVGTGRAAVRGGGSSRRGSGSSGGGSGMSTDGKPPSEHPARLIHGLRRPGKVPGRKRFRRGGSMPDDLGGYTLMLDGGGGFDGEGAGGGGQGGEAKGVESCAGAMDAASRKWEMLPVLPPTELAPTKPQQASAKHAIAAASEWSSLQRSPSIASSSRRDSQNWPDDEVVNYSSQHTASGSSCRRLSPAGFAYSPGHHVFSSGDQRQHALQKQQNRERQEREDAELTTTQEEKQRSNEGWRNLGPLETTAAAATTVLTTTTKPTAGRPRRPLVVPPLPRVLYHPLPNDTSSRPSAARQMSTSDNHDSVAIVDGKPQLTISKLPLSSRPPRSARYVTAGSSQRCQESQASSRGLKDKSKNGHSGPAPPSAASTSTSASTKTRAHSHPRKLGKELKQQALYGHEGQHGASHRGRSMNDGREEGEGEAFWPGPEDGRGRDGGRNVNRRESRSLSPLRQGQQGHQAYMDRLRAGRSTRNSQRGSGIGEGSNRSLSLSSALFSTNDRAAPENYRRPSSTSNTNPATTRSARSSKGTTGVARVCAALSVPWIGRGRSNRNRNQGKGKISPGEADEYRTEGGEDEGYYGGARVEVTPGGRSSTRSSTRSSKRSQGILLRRRRHTDDDPPSTFYRATRKNASGNVERAQTSAPPSVPARRPQQPPAAAAGVSTRSTGLSNDVGNSFPSRLGPQADKRNSIDLSSSSSGLRWLNPMGQEGRGALTATGIGPSRLLGVLAKVKDTSASESKPKGVSTFEDEEEEAQRRMETLLMRSQIHSYQHSVTGGKSDSYQPPAVALPAAQAVEGVIPVRRRQ